MSEKTYQIIDPLAHVHRSLHVCGYRDSIPHRQIDNVISSPKELGAWHREILFLGPCEVFLRSKRPRKGNAHGYIGCVIWGINLLIRSSPSFSVPSLSSPLPLPSYLKPSQR